MVALWNRADHYIFMLWFLSSFFPCLISAATHWMSTILPHMVWYSANLERRSETCCTRLTENTGRKKLPSGHHRTTLSGYIFATKACLNNRKKLVKQQYLLHRSWLYGELRPTSGWDRFTSLRHPCKFQRVSHLGSVTARHSSSGREPNCAVEQRAPPIFGRAAITLALAHISSLLPIIWFYSYVLIL